VAAIELSKVTKHFGDTVVIPGLDLQVRDGEFMVFVGPSGCGKSTMLRMIAGLETMTAGRIAIDGEDVSAKGPSERGAAMVFQSYALYPHMTVEENMGFGLRMSGTSKKETATLVHETADRLQLTPLLKRYPKQLSGGQRQRVAIGRAIVRRPKVFLFDEPLSNLDASLRVQMRIELAKLHADLKTTMVYVTHDQTEAMTLGDRIAVFNQGRIEQVGAPMDHYKAPANTFVAQFLGSPKINLFAYTVDAAHHRIQFDSQTSMACSDLGLNTPQALSGVLMGVRPEAIRLGEPGSGLQGVIEFTEQLGDSTIVYVRLPWHPELVTVKLTQQQISRRMGESIGMHLDPMQVHWFDAQNRRLTTT
jgi:ABC-type branched-subunit amino acid transport system ATPase component